MIGKVKANINKQKKNSDEGGPGDNEALEIPVIKDETDKPITKAEIKKKITQLDGFIKRVQERVGRYQQSLLKERALSVEQKKILKKGMHMYKIHEDDGVEI
ncbi:hypothetical protein ACFL96_10415 [Thermoproteota archaeon]